MKQLPFPFYDGDIAELKRIGHTLMMPAQGKAPLGLEEITGISAQHTKAA